MSDTRIDSVHTKVNDWFQLQVSAKGNAQLYACYLMRAHEVVQKIPYSHDADWTFNVLQPGEYRVRFFGKNPGEEPVTSSSPTIKLNGLAFGPRQTDSSPVYFLGVNRMTFLAALICNRRRKVAGFILPRNFSGTKSSVLGWPVYDLTHLPVGTTWAPKGTDSTSYGNIVAQEYNCTPGSHDVLSQEMNQISAIDLYHISHELFKLGLISEAGFIQGFIQSKYNSRVPYEAQIGTGTRLGIGGVGAVIHPRSVIGKNCVIGQQVTIGGRVNGTGFPVIGDNVFIAPGAKVLAGPIGSNVVIGANSVVLSSVPDNCVVAGVPARIVSRDMSKYGAYTGVKG